ncbi:MAG: cysteine desulfurase [Candidatus Paceibacteria bacterium]
MTIYLDNAATTPLRKEVWEVMLPFMKDSWGNPSSVHRRGVAAREAIDRARAQVARALGAKPRFVTFTGGGTAANNLALLGVARSQSGQKGDVCIGPTEHASVRAAAEALSREGHALHVGALTPEGKLDLTRQEQTLSHKTCVVAQMLVSNEFGSIYPTAQVASLIRARAPGAWLHVDAVQGLGKLPLSLTELGADSLSISAHKVHGPQGVGALVRAREGELKPLVYGGGQESGLHSGTENVAGIVGFGKAVELAAREQRATLDRLWQRRAEFLDGLSSDCGIEPLMQSDDAHQQPGILSLLVPGAPAEVWLHHLDAQDVVVSVGSACQASKKEVSPVLLAAGIDARRARQVLRLSFGDQTSAQNIQDALSTFEGIARDLATL